MKELKKAVIFSPFWRQAGHVGNYRVDRYVRWLAANGYEVVLVRAGSSSRQREMSWGLEITVRDTLGLYREVAADGAPIRPRKPNRLRRWSATWLFNPDPGIVWARAAARAQCVVDAAAGAAFVLSSSPPESAHVGAAILARRLKSGLVIDMRDGWLDDPLKPLLRSSTMRRWMEGRLEKSVLRRADKVLVTSNVWRSLLEERLPFTRGKTAILTNGFPLSDSFDLKPLEARSGNRPIRLVHAGRFTGSRLSQNVRHLLEPLSLGFGDGQVKGTVTLLGDLEPADLAAVQALQSTFSAGGWTIEVRSAVPRDEMMSILSQADGHLLLSASEAALPSKLFEYLPLGLPVFVATPRSSALWQIGNTLEQMFLADYRQPNREVARQFVQACVARNASYHIPSEFSEAALSETLLREVGEVRASR